MSTHLSHGLPTPDDVRAAARRIAGHAHRTPVLSSRLVDEQLGARVVFKCENLQRTGAFKFRGAFNALSRFTPEQRRAGVVAFSSGNHAQAVSLAAAELGIPATIVMPYDAPAAKVAATKAYGGEVVRYDRYTEDRVAIGRELARTRGLTLLPPYDHPDIIAGQGTAALELFEEVGTLDALFVPVGGAGLLCGTTLAARALSPGCELHGVEPEAGDDVRRSLREGRIVRIDTPETLADGAQTQFMGELPFGVLSQDPPRILTATDAELVDAMHTFATYLKLVVEPTGCLGLAGLRAAAGRLRGRRVGVIVSGGNIDLERYAGLLRDR
ncbi:threo-3-hydroxy-L-aspartate ammonia-lyase [Streptomyces antimicrobicus]|uniref:Threo-3-hydroxy-L-aspartate ammonia-lyase n=1 Tax=Streptomyces antimicrobicus TaxID=2883108 RepID=A0ABS8BB29_9ACTN|nr:threo-3-hydroxy-L-aspartate ammonia-lyase [Streptomyces antimicrobicus]MCB5181814.1 threo-3-hydroxy-L-aspartate ammonia-lyase [Streptomyces antimicrobicus]